MNKKTWIWIGVLVVCVVALVAVLLIGRHKNADIGIHTLVLPTITDSKNIIEVTKIQATSTDLKAGSVANSSVKTSISKPVKAPVSSASFTFTKVGTNVQSYYSNNSKMLDFPNCTVPPFYRNFPYGLKVKRGESVLVTNSSGSLALFTFGKSKISLEGGNSAVVIGKEVGDFDVLCNSYKVGKIGVR